MILEPHKNITPQAGIHAKKNDEQQHRFIGSVIKRKGHRLYKFNLATKEVSEVKIIKEAAVMLNGAQVVKNKATYQKNHLYTEALNCKNAEKKFKKILSKIKAGKLKL